jgi:spore photoproduct lyase
LPTNARRKTQNNHGKINEFDERKDTPTARQRKAAYKAWKTMRTSRRVRVVKDIEKIDRVFSSRKLETLVHPEMIKSPDGNKAVSYGRGIVSLFHKTPPDIGCGEFWEVRWAYGCPLDCNYCYLRGTMKGKMKPSPVRVEHVLKALDEAFQAMHSPVIFNSGELSDSLMYPSIMEKIVDKFEEQKKHKILLLSKMGIRNIDFLLRKKRSQTICAWSLNAPEVAIKWERAAASPRERIIAAKMVNDIGYDTRIRIDPIFPIQNWKIHYGELLYELLSEFEPKKIILGTPRGLWKTIKYAKEAGVDMSWSQFFSEDSGWGKKITFSKRKEIYQFFLDKLISLGFSRDKITFCKETVDMWRELGLTFTPMTCNCYGTKAYE